MKTRAEAADPQRLYQLAVQAPECELAFISDSFERLRGRTPTLMREDFCGSALSACQWVELSPAHRAVAVDLDPAVLDWAAANNRAALDASQQARLLLVQGDAREVSTAPVEVIQAFNFSYWIFTERADLLAYFRHLHGQLCDDGVLYLDVFGGSEAHQVQTDSRELGDGVSYEWEQARYNAITAEMDCHIHFAFDDGSRLERAFSYHWRVWGVRELRELLAEAGYGRVTLHRQAFDEHSEEPLNRYLTDDSGEDFACFLGYLVAEK